jgi:hypothetical protein
MNATLKTHQILDSPFSGAPAVVLGKCKTKGCKCALRAQEGVGVSLGRDATLEGVAYRVGNYGYFGRCTDHGLFPLRTLKGRYVPEKACDARCMNATGPNCDCSCGGANHGHAHMA